MISKTSVLAMSAEYQQLQQRMRELEAEMPIANRKEIEAEHSSVFVQCVGLQTLNSITVVDPKILNLDGIESVSKNHINSVTPDLMKNHASVRGLDCLKRPFIAIKVDLFDSKTKQKVAQVVELVFNRNSLDNSNIKCPASYTTTYFNMGDDGNAYNSGLISNTSHEMNQEQFIRLGKLLNGEKIDHPDGYVMQIAQQDYRA